MVRCSRAFLLFFLCLSVSLLLFWLFCFFAQRCTSKSIQSAMAIKMSWECAAAITKSSPKKIDRNKNTFCANQIFDTIFNVACHEIQLNVNNSVAIAWHESGWSSNQIRVWSSIFSTIDTYSSFKWVRYFYFTCVGYSAENWHFVCSLKVCFAFHSKILKII